ncbi:MAG: 3-dehydroquinate synthase [Candidatus Phytoplasma sp.]|nr:3-dehydroquinate synthase [Phytoplasma sp.]
MIEINLKTYQIEIEENLIEKLPSKIKNIYEHEKLFIITDENVYALYHQKISHILKDFNLFWSIVKPGESSKSLETYQKTISDLIYKGIKRNHLIIALGGGVVGDLAGFISATLYRGLPYIQIPTTLLAQVDSSIGGKTGIDLLEGKNLIGSFYDPKYVLIDPNFLETLDPKEYANGIAEMLKAGLIGSPILYEHIKNKQKITSKEIAMAIDVKKEVVDIDPYDQKERMFLNFGHTFGHAIEKKHHYLTYKHGEAISYGMLIALEIGIKKKITPSFLYDEVKNILLSYKLIKEPLLKKENYIELIYHDKKNIADNLHFIAITEIGRPMIFSLKEADI